MYQTFLYILHIYSGQIVIIYHNFHLITIVLLYHYIKLKMSIHLEYALYILCKYILEDFSW